MNFHQNNKSVVEHLQYVANYNEENWACSSTDGSYGRWQGDRWADKISVDFIISTNQTIQIFYGQGVITVSTSHFSLKLVMWVLR